MNYELKHSAYRCMDALRDMIDANPEIEKLFTACGGHDATTLDLITEELSTDLHYHQITALSKDDFEERGFDADSLTDDDLQRMTSKMADVYVCDGHFWTDVDHWASEYNLPKVECPEEEDDEE